MAELNKEDQLDSAGPHRDQLNKNAYILTAEMVKVPPAEVVLNTTADIAKNFTQR